MSDIETDDSYWGFGRYCMQGDLIGWSQSRQQFVEQSLLAQALLFKASADLGYPGPDLAGGRPGASWWEASAQLLHN